MTKRKVFFIIATLTITLIGCSQVEEGTFIQGNIENINEKSGDMEIEIEAWTTVSESAYSTNSFDFAKKPTSQTIQVSNPEDYQEGQKIEVKVIKNYEEDVWDIDRLKFEVKELN
ncbi:hypothetical protein [Radiobacillus deserti]|uniref:DUF3221 domain-containing protein n=1 Tax=Radiobacillus deserti TaxID=2594883 RepID=A0A516KIF4_9BACI|nr:hypothetical protein [Radiobacillus deserti]QDP41185.1 hypothetical protein FN924_13905 [Radiobacillus deserti]